MSISEKEYSEILERNQFYRRDYIDGWEHPTGAFLYGPEILMQDTAEQIETLCKSRVEVQKIRNAGGAVIRGSKTLEAITNEQLHDEIQKASAELNRIIANTRNPFSYESIEKNSRYEALRDLYMKFFEPPKEKL